VFINTLITGSGRNATGEVRFGNMDVHVDVLEAGVPLNSSDTENIAADIYLHGGRLFANNITLDGVDAESWIHVEVLGQPAGVVLTDSSTLNIEEGGIAITFYDPDPGFLGNYSGLLWGGNQVSTIEGLISGGLITLDTNNLSPEWSDSIEVLYLADDDQTMIGVVIPEPALIPAIAALALLGSYAASRRRRKIHGD